MKLVWAAVALFAGAGSVQAQTTECVSVDPAGLVADGYNYGPGSVSADGRFVAFASSVTTLVAGDTNNRTDVFVRDRLTATTWRVSVDSTGQQGNEGSNNPYISADGRFVAFCSVASNLVPNDTNNTDDVFVHDRQAGTTIRASVNSSGAEGNDVSRAYSISADGLCVAFWSRATNLVAGDTNSQPDCFVHELSGLTTERVSVGLLGLQANNESSAPVLSADGRFVAFGSRATNLAPGDTNGVWDIFVRDRVGHMTYRVSVDSNGVEGNLGSYGSGDPSTCPSISADGRFVAFLSNATNLAAGDTNGKGDIFVRDRLNGVTERVSVDSSGVQANETSVAAFISGDGRYVAFESAATNLVAGDTNGSKDVFVHDRLGGATERVSVDSAGVQGDFHSKLPCLTPDGRTVTFWSFASNLVANDWNWAMDVFLRELGPPPVASFCTPGQAGTIDCPCANPPLGARRGCDNSQGTGGASISASGSASLAADSLHLTTAAERTSAESIVLQGTIGLSPGVAFGMGVRCVGGTLKRLYVETASGGSIGVPNSVQASISARSSALGDTIQAGEHRFYLVYYRDPFLLGGCSATSTFNVTNAVDVPWSP